MDQDHYYSNGNYYQQPRWLDIQSQLYPQTIITKRIICQNPTDGLFEQLYAQVKYISKSREIDITRPITHVIHKNYQNDLKFYHSFSNKIYQKDQHKTIHNNHQFQFNSNKHRVKPQLRVLFFDSESQNFFNIGQYPFEEKSLLLGQQFLEMDLITIRLQPCGYFQQVMVQNFQKNTHSNQMNHSLNYSMGNNNKDSLNLNFYQPKSYENNDQCQYFLDSPIAYPMISNKQRTIREVLQKLGQWRRMYHQNKKLSLQQSAKEINIPKRTLDDYYLQVRLAQKYGFDFDKNINEGMGVLRKFVKQKHCIQKKKNEPVLKILQKFKNKNKNDKQ